ncbi:MAG: polysaccharide deacetylase family protein [Anaerolineales bacterium]|nr:polysaccharide deacetylase family protein [Anaerolineales bacterium]
MLVLILFVMGAILGGRETAESESLSQVTTGTATAVTTTTSTPSRQPQKTPTLKPTSTSTATPSSTPTKLPSPTITRPPTNTPIPTVTAVTSPSATEPPTPTATTPPLPTPAGVYSWTLKVPILMYHYISVPPEDADIYRVDLSVTPDDFRAQMQYLAENGYTTVDFYDLALAITNKIDLPPKPVIITMDDGYVDNYVHAFPILQEFGQKATFFVVTEFIDFGNPGYLTWDMVQEMSAAGMRIESHSRTHPDLRAQPRDYLIWQILGSQETIAAHIGYTPRFFSYPAGQYDEDTVTILQELDFWGAVVTAGGKWHGFDDRYAWTRLRVRNTTPLAEFIDLVDAGDAVSGKSASGE